MFDCVDNTFWAVVVFECGLGGKCLDAGVAGDHFVGVAGGEVAAEWGGAAAENG